MAGSKSSSSDRPEHGPDPAPSAVDPTLAALARRYRPIIEPRNEWGAWTHVQMVDLGSSFDTAEEIVEAWVKRLGALAGVNRLDVIDLVDQRQPLLPSTREVLRHLLDGGASEGATAILKSYETHVAWRALQEDLAWGLWILIKAELRPMDRIADATGRAMEAVGEVFEGRSPASTGGAPSQAGTPSPGRSAAPTRADDVGQTSLRTGPPFPVAALNDADRAVLIALEHARRSSPPEALNGKRIKKLANAEQLFDFRDANHVRRTVTSLRARKWPIPNARNGTGYRLDRPLSELCPELASGLGPSPTIDGQSQGH